MTMALFFGSSKRVRTVSLEHFVDMVELLGVVAVSDLRRVIDDDKVSAQASYPTVDGNRAHIPAASGTEVR